MFRGTTAGTIVARSPMRERKGSMTGYAIPACSSSSFPSQLAVSIPKILFKPLDACWKEKQTMSQQAASSELSSRMSPSDSMILIRLSVPLGCHAELCRSAFLSLRGNIRRCFAWLVGCSSDPAHLKDRSSYTGPISVMTKGPE